VLQVQDLQVLKLLNLFWQVSDLVVADSKFSELPKLLEKLYRQAVKLIAC
jgi:hypothetical protein